MLPRSVTLDIPEPLYSRAERAAGRLHRPVDEILLRAVDTALPSEAGLPPELAQAMDELIFVNDETLWEAARRTLPPERAAQFEELIAASKLRLLAPPEQRALDGLVMEYQRVMLVRAKAAVLLQTRGYDLSDLTAPSLTVE